MNLTDVGFTYLGPLSTYTRETLAPHLGEHVQQLFTYGVGFIGDGMIRTVDPVRLAQPVSALSSPVHADHAIAILTSAFGDVVTYWRSRLLLLNSRHGTYIGLGRASRLAAVIQELSNPNQREQLLGPAPWAQAVHHFGVPGVTECFGYTPPLTVMPRQITELKGLHRVDLAEHLQFLADFHGRAQMRW